MSTPLAAFGPGIAICRRTDIVNGVAVNVGFAQELSLELAGTVKELYGQKQYPIVAARGTIKATGKLKAATLSGLAWNNLFFGQGFTTGGLLWNIDESGVIPTTPFTITVTNAATFDADLGVKYATTGLPLQRVTAGSEAVGKYSVTESGASKGKYVFSTSDAALTVLLTYTSTIAGGQQMIVTNQLIGSTPTFQLDYYTNLNQPTTKPFIVRVYVCVGSKIIPLMGKLEDYTQPEVDFSFYANASDQVMNLVFPEVS